MKIYEQYGEYEIQYNEDRNLWMGLLNREEAATAESLLDLKKALDKHKKKMTVFERISIFAEGRLWREEGPFKDGKITSITSDNNRWVTWADKSREKISGKWGGALFIVTPENMEKRGKYEELEKQKNVIEKKQDEILKTMEIFKQEEENA